MTDLIVIEAPVGTQFREAALPFIYSTWLRSFRHSGILAKNIDSKIFYEWHHKVIDRILSRGAKVLLATSQVDWPIFGYMVYEELPSGEVVIHYAYIKKAFRGMGILNKMLKESPANIDKTSFSHWTKFCNTYIDKHKYLTYNPYFT